MNFNTGSSIMQDKVFLDDYVNIVENCNVKCLKSYDQAKLLPKEQQCLEKCYFKSLGMSKLLNENYGDLMYQISQADK